MAIHQISVFLENRAGQLAEITAWLAKNGVDLRAINIAETSDYGVLRLIASHEPEACRVLRETASSSPRATSSPSVCRMHPAG